MMALRLVTQVCITFGYSSAATEACSSLAAATLAQSSASELTPASSARDIESVRVVFVALSGSSSSVPVPLNAARALVTRVAEAVVRDAGALLERLFLEGLRVYDL